jgi:hypothetical protein
MHNPLQLYSPRLLNSLIRAGHKYFVRQTYKRGVNHFDAEPKGAFLISHYNDLSKAQQHYDALKDEEKRFLYDISNTEHLEKLKATAQQPTGYKIYTPLLLEEWKPSRDMAEKIRAYINHKLRWRPGREERVHTNLFLEFGELFITLKFRGYNEEVPLSDIEKA